MRRYRVNQQLIAVKLYKNSSHGTYYCENFSESKFDVNTVKSTTQQVRVFRSNRMFGTKHLKTNRLQKTIDYKTNEKSTK